MQHTHIHTTRPGEKVSGAHAMRFNARAHVPISIEAPSTPWPPHWKVDGGNDCAYFHTQHAYPLSASTTGSIINCATTENSCNEFGGNFLASHTHTHTTAFVIHI